MKVDFNARNPSDPLYLSGFWYHIIRELRKDSGVQLYNDEYEQWLYDTWGIKVLHEVGEFPAIISGIEFSEEVLTALLIKYPPSEL